MVWNLNRIGFRKIDRVASTFVIDRQAATCIRRNRQYSQNVLYEGALNRVSDECIPSTGLTLNRLNSGTRTPAAARKTTRSL